MSARKAPGAWAVILFAALVLAPAPSEAQQVERSDPVVLEGCNLPDMVGAKIENIRVYAFKEGRFEQVPFQVDQRVEKGWPRGRATYVFPPEKDDDPSFDENDELVMLASDFGAVSPSATPVFEKGYEPYAVSRVRAENRNGGVYAYIAAYENPPEAEAGEYIRWDGSDRKVISEGRYRVGYGEKEPYFFNEIAVAAENGGNGKDFVDTLKFRANIRIISKLFVYDVTNGDWRNELVGVIDGPVRVIRRVKTHAHTVVFGIHDNIYDLKYYPDFFTMDIHVPMGTWKAGFYYAADARLSVDLSDDAPPMLFFNPNNPPNPKRAADGKLTEEEKDMDYSPAKWLALSGEAGTVMFRLDQKKGSGLQQDLYYMDDAGKDDPPEEYPGHRGDSGFNIENIQRVRSSRRTFTMTFAFPPSRNEEDFGRLLDTLDRPVKVRVSDGKTVEVQGETPAALPPDEREEGPRPSYLPPPIETRTRGYLPQILADPNLGYGSGFQVVERKTLGTDLSSDFLFLVSHRLYQFYRLKEDYENLGPIDDVAFYAEYILHPNRYFFGIGNDQTPDDLTVYRQERALAWLRLRRNITDWLRVGVKIEFMHNAIGHGELFSGDEPSIEEKYGASEDIEGARFGPQVYGLEGGYTNSLALEAALDFRDDDVYPRNGTYDIFTASHTPRWLGSDYEYSQYRMDLRFYYGGRLINPEDKVPHRLWPRVLVGSQVDRVLAFRLVAQHTDAEKIRFAGRNVKDIPFFNMSYFGDAMSSRGHYWAQWADNDVTFAMLELRWHFWKIIDATLFYDTGRVWKNLNDRAEWRDADFGDLHHGYGLGCRFHMVPDLFMRVDYGFSKENPGGLLYIYVRHTF